MEDLKKMPLTNQLESYRNIMQFLQVILFYPMQKTNSLGHKCDPNYGVRWQRTKKKLLNRNKPLAVHHRNILPQLRVCICK